MPCSRYLVYQADPDQAYGWDEKAQSFTSLRDAIQEVEFLLDPRHRPFARVAIYQLVEVFREEPTEPEG